MCSITILPTDCGCQIQNVIQTTDSVILVVHSTTPTTACPECQFEASRVHSRYQRSPRDLPCFGIQISLQLHVRRFVCDNHRCLRKIFTERLPQLAKSYACCTDRLAFAQLRLALALGGEPARRLARILGIPGSAETMLRRIQVAPEPGVAQVYVLRVDDWAFRRGQRYGSILCDLEKHQVIGLLPDRKAETLSSWLRDHPEVEIITRDRSGEQAGGEGEGWVSSVFSVGLVTAVESGTSR